MLPVYILSFCTGFLSLSLEILWIRLFGYTNLSSPQTFAFVLAFYLIGIAIGAEIGRRFCILRFNLWLASGIMLFFSSIADVLNPWIYAYYSQRPYQLYLAAGLIIITALLKATVFPMVHHLGVPESVKTIGRRIATVYVANILGATLGPIFVGVFLLSAFSTQHCFIICAALTFLLSMYCLLNIARHAVLGFATVAGLFFFGFMMTKNSDWLILKTSVRLGDVRRIIENQYGIITIFAGGQGGDIVTGGNVYDGRTNLDPILNSNGLNRVIVMAALSDHPKNVLMIGLSIGTWLKIISSFQGVENIDVVEINPGYLKAIKSYPAQFSALLDHRVHIHINDGRRWLKLHPDRKYDLVIMNTTHHWRTYSSNLLSREFLQLMKQHMQADGVVAFNTTGSPDALKTANKVFSYAYLYENFVIAADFDWRKKMSAKDSIKKLAALNLDGKPLFPEGSDEIIQRFLQQRTISLVEIEPFYAALGRKLEVITDRNLITEYKYGRSLTEK